LSGFFVSRVRFVFGILGVALVVLAGCRPAEPVANVEPESKKVAVFEGGEVTLGEVQEFAEQSGLGELTPDSPQYEAAIAQIMPQLVDIEVAKAYARENGITVSEEDVNQEIENIKDQVVQQARAQGEKKLSPDEIFEQALKQAGITEGQLRDQIRETLPVQKVQERVAGDAEPSQEEVQTFYDENKDLQFTTPEQRCVRHILFNKDQKEKAEEAKSQLEDGGDSRNSPRRTPRTRRAPRTVGTSAAWVRVRPSRISRRPSSAPKKARSSVRSRLSSGTTSSM
jgi:peptidyl-prolyl cis-trans isomerase C